jgi:ABC-type lipoprotein release transport system permease subunit
MILYLVMDGMFAGIDRMTMKNYVDFETGHFKVLSANYDEDAPYSVSNVISGSDGLMEKIGKEDFVVAQTRRVQFPAEIDNGIDATPCLVNGIDRETDHLVFATTNFLVDGHFPLEDGSALIGVDLARQLGLEVGSLFFLTFRNGQGMIDSVSFTVTGLLNAPSPVVNSSGVYISLSESFKLLDLDGVTEISLLVKDPRKTSLYEQELLKIVGNLTLKSWKELSQNVTALMDTKKKFTYFFIVALLVIAVVGIVNTMLMSIFEKTREIGMLKAIGMSNREILLLFMSEGFLIGSIGGICGVLIGSLLNGILVTYGMDYGSMMKGSTEMLGNLRMENVVYSAWNLNSLIFGLLICPFLGIVASYLPAKKATQLQAVECLRVV